MSSGRESLVGMARHTLARAGGPHGLACESRGDGLHPSCSARREQHDTICEWRAWRDFLMMWRDGLAAVSCGVV